MKYKNYAPAPSSFGQKSSAITPNDSADLPEVVKAVVTLSFGDIALIPALDPVDGSIDPVVFVGVPAGFLPPFRVRRIMATGTTCSVRAVED